MVVITRLLEDTDLRLAGVINEFNLVLEDNAGQFLTFTKTTNKPELIIEGFGYSFMRYSTVHDRYYGGVYLNMK